MNNEHFDLAQQIMWEQRRYETARDCLAALLVDPDEFNVQFCAMLAVKAADALLDELTGLKVTK